MYSQVLMLGVAVLSSLSHIVWSCKFREEHIPPTFSMEETLHLAPLVIYGTDVLHYIDPNTHDNTDPATNNYVEFEVRHS